ncbi:hypothetical protein C8J56DRAFT_185505 [Mycena floridula]|nr:hypothetical protein C8J56DRAFT_185505 [Mycena floridula]
MLVMFVPWMLIIFMSRLSYADFHVLNCVSSGAPGSTTGIPTNPTITVPTSNMSSCAGVLGDRMSIVQGLTEPVGKASVFSIDNFCDARRLDVYLTSPDLMGIFYSGGDGTLIGACSPSPARNYSCTSQAVGTLDCTDAWTCFTGICEAPREGSTTGTTSPTLVTQTSELPSITSPSTSTVLGQKSEGGSKKSNSAVVVGVILGLISALLGGILAYVFWRRRTKSRESQLENAPPIDQSESPTIQPFLALRSTSLHSSSSVPGPEKYRYPSGSHSRTVGSQSEPSSESPIVDALRMENQLLRETIHSGSRNVVSWRTDTLPPSYFNADTL